MFNKLISFFVFNSHMNCTCQVFSGLLDLIFLYNRGFNIFHKKTCIEFSIVYMIN